MPSPLLRATACDAQQWHGATHAKTGVDSVVAFAGKGEEFGVNATLDGIMDDASESANQLADRVIAQDAVAKLRLAAMNRAATGQPFYLAVGFRKPHLPFRFPKPFLQYLQPLEDIAVAQHPTLDRSVPLVAHGDHPPQSGQYGPYNVVPSKSAAPLHM